jgi:hypothetical protein
MTFYTIGSNGRLYIGSTATRSEGSLLALALGLADSVISDRRPEVGVLSPVWKIDPLRVSPELARLDNLWRRKRLWPAVEALTRQHSVLL